ncbi:MAG: ABC transporter ATP-binding protein [Gammaproteobacteria bacterium]
MGRPVTGTDSPHTEEDERAALRWLLGFVRPHRSRLIAILILSLVSTGLGLAQPYITKFLIDDGLIAKQFNVIVWLCVLLVTAGLLAAGLGALNRWYYVDMSSRILLALRENVFGHLQQLSPAFHTQARGGDLLARLDGDIAEIQRFAVDSMLAFVNGFIALAGALVLMLSLSWQLSLLAFVLLPAVFVFLRRMRPHVEGLTRAVRERASDITSFFFDRLAAIKFIQSVAAEDRETRRLSGLHHTFRSDLLRLQMTSYATNTVPGVLISISTAIVFVVGGYLTIQGQLTLGTLIAFSAYLARATGPVQTLLGLYLAFQRARVSLRRVMEVTHVEPAVTQADTPLPIPSTAAGELRFECVSFRYAADDPEVLSGIDISIPAGKKVGLSGISGVGKTTLIDLLQRHYDPTNGRIQLDGIDLRRLDLHELRRRVAVVAQDTVLFSGSIIDNVRYAAPDASDDDVRKAAELSQVDAFVSELPQGYETEIGARGTRLSGGQRQRLAIARALLQDPLVLVLDEATSEVDEDTEVRVSTAIDELFAGRTRIVISHRPSTLTNADLVLCLGSNGHIDEVMPHNNPPPLAGREPASLNGKGE